VRVFLKFFKNLIYRAIHYRCNNVLNVFAILYNIVSLNLSNFISLYRYKILNKNFMLLKICNKFMHGKRMKGCVQIYTNNVFR